ncbi:unnamed protein product [Eruca vesicaria subsp. sativa]|uniref:Uncharacterized protein n=1 Tax=Eruca vesicaria subsp. sativa TaxID=29727 RepID=A0ABC8L471_ERUVS|nr:unnamed protein product [Eruca vesicaria subsp. sativa]
MALQTRNLEDFRNNSRPSTSRLPNTISPAQIEATATSPIRTLSEDRRHVTLRLGPCQNSDSQEDVPLALSKGKRAITATKVLGKKKVTKPATKKRVVKSPLQGTNSKKRRIAKVQSSPKNKLMADAIAGGAHVTSSTVGSQPKTKWSYRGGFTDGDLRRNPWDETKVKPKLA